MLIDDTHDPLTTKIARWIAYHLPASVAMWAVVRVLNHTTKTLRDPTPPSEVTVYQALNNWEGYE